MIERHHSLARPRQAPRLSLPSRLTDSLHRSLGRGPAEDLMSWMDDVATQLSKMAEFREKMRGDMAELRHEVHRGFARVERILSVSLVIGGVIVVALCPIAVVALIRTFR